MLTAYVIRHAETEGNRNGVIQGHLDFPLSAKGRLQAEEVAGALRNVRFDAVYSSDLNRAAETARAIMKCRSCSLIMDRRLREINGGKMQGLTWPEIQKRFPEFEIAFSADPYNTRRPGGESFADVAVRVARAMDDIVRRNSERPEGSVIAVVSHGGPIRSIIGLAQPDLATMGTIGNCSITVLERNGATWRLVKVGDCGHLACLSED